MRKKGLEHPLTIDKLERMLGCGRQGWTIFDRFVAWPNTEKVAFTMEETTNFGAWKNDHKRLVIGHLMDA